MNIYWIRALKPINQQWKHDTGLLALLIQILRLLIPRQTTGGAISSRLDLTSHDLTTDDMSAFFYLFIYFSSIKITRKQIGLSIIQSRPVTADLRAAEIWPVAEQLAQIDLAFHFFFMFSLNQYSIYFNLCENDGLLPHFNSSGAAPTSKSRRALTLTPVSLCRSGSVCSAAFPCV